MNITTLIIDDKSLQIVAVPAEGVAVVRGPQLLQHAAHCHGLGRVVVGVIGGRRGCCISSLLRLASLLIGLADLFRDGGLSALLLLGPLHSILEELHAVGGGSGGCGGCGGRVGDRGRRAIRRTGLLGVSSSTSSVDWNFRCRGAGGSRSRAILFGLLRRRIVELVVQLSCNELT